MLFLFVQEACELPLTIGDCRGRRAAFPRVYFDSSDGQCKDFIYGGCEGNANNFRNKEECEELCGGIFDTMLYVLLNEISPFIIIAFIILLYVIAVLEPSSLHGCRGPNEIFEMKSCKSCCIQGVRDCFKSEATGGADWYNRQRFLSDQTCPDDCPKCASCLLRDEEQLMSLKPPEQCNPRDCRTMEIGVDPCCSRCPYSCECFCYQTNRLMMYCPDVKPDWFSG